jgi:biopolymer transport protein ExbD
MKTRRIDHETNAGAMADIAFLLLIFFMVVTTFNKAYELELSLPPKKENTRKGKISKQRLLTIHLNAQSGILIGDKIYPAEESYSLTDEIKRITSSKQSGVIKINMHPDTPYGSYLQLMSNIKRDKELILDELAEESYGQSFKELNGTNKKTLLAQTTYSITEIQTERL